MKTVIEMAREAGIESTYDPTETPPKTFVECWMEELERFANLVRADEREQGQKWFDAVTAQHKQAILAEREACAKVAEDSDHVVKGRGYYDQLGDADATVINVVAAIRARSNT